MFESCVFGPTSVVESVADSFGFSVCVLAVPPSVPDVTVLFSKRMWFLSFFFFQNRTVNLLNRRPFLSPETAKRVLWKAKNL